MEGIKIGDVGVAALGECLRHNTSLKTLKLGSNGIGDDDAAALAEFLRENTSLTTLNLEGNKIGDVGVAALVAARECHPSLKVYFW